MPTFEVLPGFWSEYDHLTPKERSDFLEALGKFIEGFREHEESKRAGVPRFPRSLGVTHMRRNVNIMEMAWAPDGRCTWMYGTPQIAGKFHVIWIHIGTHAIYDLKQ